VTGTFSYILAYIPLFLAYKKFPTLVFTSCHY